MSDIIYNLALIGSPVTHSKSPQIHAQFFKDHNLKGSYSAIECSTDRLQETLLSLQQLGFRGTNVTIPHKENILKYVTKITPETQSIGAANTIIFEPSGEIIADNTDYLGFWHSLPIQTRENLSSAVILGSGGSAKAVITALIKFSSISHITIVTRNPNTNKSQALLDNCHIYNNTQQKNIVFFITDRLKDLPTDNTIVINTTPIGMEHHSEGQIPFNIELESFHNTCYIYDLIYTPKETELIKKAYKQSLPNQNGEMMLYLQAKESFKIWTEI